MPNNSECPMSETQRDLLQMCVRYKTIHDKDLAELRFVSAHTIHTEFRDTLEVLGVHSRFAAVMVAIAQGWIAEPSL
jgi:DNA-binding NarL/FixJ family response regulator